MAKLELQKQPEKGSVTFTLRIPNGLSDRLERLVVETGISKNAIINKMIRFGLENYEVVD